MTDSVRPPVITADHLREWAIRRGDVPAIAEAPQEKLEEIAALGNQRVQAEFDEMEARREEAREVHQDES